MPSIHIGTTRSHRIGLAAIAVSWVSAGLINSVMKVLNNRTFEPEELLVIRSILCMIACLALAGRAALRGSRYLHISGFVVGISSICFYRAISAWTVNYVLAALSIMPIMNVIIARSLRRHIPRSVYICMAVIIGGVIWSLEIWKDEPFDAAGLGWTLACAVLSAIGFEMIGTGRGELTQKVFALSLGTLCLSVGILAFTGKLEWSRYADATNLQICAVFGIPATIYIFSTMIPFSRHGEMDVAWASVFLMGATPASMGLSYLILGEKLNASQMAGVAVALGASAVLAFQLCRAEQPAASREPAPSK